MKKLMLLTLMPLLMAGCGGNTSTATKDYKDLRYFVPTGAPSIAMAAFADLKDFETTSVPKNISDDMALNKVDVAVLPTNVGVAAIKKSGLPYKMLCTITFGNFYLAATGNDSDGVIGEDDYIASFEQGAVPDKVFHYVYGNTLDNALHYVGAASDAARCLALGTFDDGETVHNVDYVLVAEPLLTNNLKQNPNASVYANLTEEYKTKSGKSYLPQASVFVKNILDKETVVEPIYNLINSSVNHMINDPDSIATYMNKIDNPKEIFSVPTATAIEVTKKSNAMGFGCKRASEIKDDVNQFLSIFGGITVDDQIVY